MHWNYRIFKHNTEGKNKFALHETYYNEVGQVSAWKTVADFGFYASPDDLICVLERMLVDVKAAQDDVLDFRSVPEGDFED